MQHTLFDKNAVEAAPQKILVEEKPEVVPMPIRVKFERRESEYKKKQKEKSSLHMQKLIDNDQWIFLKVEKLVRF